jgi:O-acetyl-ADP-ribose deacetylase (regulator of RNase III)
MPSKRILWTHSSATALTSAEDKIAFIRDKARAVVLNAMDKGWSGPPFDPIELAKYLEIEVEPRDDIPDARTIKTDAGTLKIEFNPSRPAGRLRYSIAHEIAHTFFPDCGEVVRNRVDKQEMSGDEWQLEMLCNIAAAELIMPIGSFPDLRDRDVSIDDLMKLRREYDVSIEALLLRFIRLTSKSCALVAASRVESGAYEGRYRLDYVVPSSSWAGDVQIPSHFREGTTLAHCTAIGYTAKGAETLTGNHPVELQCVGAPPFPGAAYPRVLALVTMSDGIEIKTPKIVYVHGDATEPRGGDPKIIAHVMNDRSQTWGGGFAKQLAIKYSAAQIDFRKWAGEEGHQVLGNVHFFGSSKGLEIATLIAQQGYGPSQSARINYPALESSLMRLGEHAAASHATVHMPRIGCGQAGGSWLVIRELIDRELIKRDVKVTVYVPPSQSIED